MDLNLTNNQTPIVVSSNTNAVNDRNYTVVANATFTDPSPVEGKGFKVFVRNGTAGIGGNSYGAKSLVFRIFHSGAWFNSLINVDTSAFVPSSRTINGLDLSANRTLTASDVGAPSGSGTNTGTNTGDETQSSILSKLGFWLIHDANEGSSIPSTAGQTIVLNEEITLIDGSFFKLEEFKAIKTGTVNTMSMRIYISNVSNNYLAPGTVQIALYNAATGNNTNAPMSRLFNVEGGKIKGFPALLSSLTDVATNTLPLGATLPSGTKYIILTLQANGSGDTAKFLSCTIKNY